MRFSLITFVAALAGVAVAQKGGVSQIPDGQVQAPTGKATVTSPPLISKTAGPKVQTGAANVLNGHAALPFMAGLAYVLA
jgi:hypothetical protein